MASLCSAYIGKNLHLKRTRKKKDHPSSDIKAHVIAILPPSPTVSKVDDYGFINREKPILTTRDSNNNKPLECHRIATKESNNNVGDVQCVSSDVNVKSKDTLNGPGDDKMTKNNNAIPRNTGSGSSTIGSASSAAIMNLFCSSHKPPLPNPRSSASVPGIPTRQQQKNNLPSSSSAVGIRCRRDEHNGVFENGGVQRNSKTVEINGKIYTQQKATLLHKPVSEFGTKCTGTRAHVPKPYINSNIGRDYQRAARLACGVVSAKDGKENFIVRRDVAKMIAYSDNTISPFKRYQDTKPKPCCSHKDCSGNPKNMCSNDNNSVSTRSANKATPKSETEVQHKESPMYENCPKVQSSIKPIKPTAIKCTTGHDIKMLNHVGLRTDNVAVKSATLQENKKVNHSGLRTDIVFDKSTPVQDNKHANNAVLRTDNMSVKSMPVQNTKGFSQTGLNTDAQSVKSQGDASPTTSDSVGNDSGIFMSAAVSEMGTRATTGNRNIYATRKSNMPQIPYPKTKAEISRLLDKTSRQYAANLPMVVIQNHIPVRHKQIGGSVLLQPEFAKVVSPPEQVTVHRGMVINTVHKSGDWVFVQTPDMAQGYVPFHCLELLGAQRNKTLDKMSKPKKDFAQQFPENTHRHHSLSYSSDQSRFDSSDDSYQLPDVCNSSSTDSAIHEENSFTDLRLRKQPLCTSSRNNLSVTTQTNSYIPTKTHSSPVTPNSFSELPDKAVPLCSPIQNSPLAASSPTEKQTAYMSMDKPKKGFSSTTNLSIVKSQSQNSIPNDLSTWSINCDESAKLIPIQTSNVLSGNETSVWTSVGDVNETIKNETVKNETQTIRKQHIKLTVLFDYDAVGDTDVSVKHQEIVTLLNDSNPDWVWIRNMEGKCGFVPRTYLVDLNLVDLDPSTKTTYL